MLLLAVLALKFAAVLSCAYSAPKSLGKNDNGFGKPVVDTTPDANQIPLQVPTLTPNGVAEVEVGSSSLTLTCETTSEGPITYTFLQNGKEVQSSASTTYTINSPQESDAGKYTCKVSNSDGKVTSSDFYILSIVVSSASQPVIVASPPEIDVGLSDTLDVNCTVSVAGWSSVAALISLTISRNNSQTGWTELAIISDFSNGHLNVMTTENMTTNGWFNASDSASVGFQWDYPADQQAGTYICAAKGFDSVGHVLVSNTAVQVSTNSPNLSDVQVKLREINIQMKTREEQMTLHVQKLELEVSELKKGKENRYSQMFESSFEYQNHTYYISRDAFYEIHVSIAICRMYGGYLAEVNDRNEFNALRSFLRSTSGLDEVYISGTDQGHEGTWTLFSGQRLPFVEWGRDEPDYKDYQNCLTFWNDGGTWRNSDYSCHNDVPSLEYRFICEMP